MAWPWLRIRNSFPLYPIIYEGPLPERMRMYAVMSEGRCLVSVAGVTPLIFVPKNGSLTIECWDAEETGTDNRDSPDSRRPEKGQN
jgi:hypothetical protein